MKRLSIIILVLFLITPQAFAAVAGIQENPKFRALDSSGDPLVGGLLYTYTAGTTTAKATYTDEAGTVPNANPVVLDSYGEAIVRLNGDYKFVLKTAAGVTLWTIDNIQSIGVSAFGATIIDDADADAVLTTLGYSYYGKMLIDDADLSAAQTTLGISTFVKTLLNDADADTFRGTLAISESDEVSFTTVNATTADITTLNVTTINQSASGTISAPRGYIDGLAMSNNVANYSTTISVAAGVCRDGADTFTIQLEAALAKSIAYNFTDTSNIGGLDIGSVAINKTYHVFALYNPTSTETSVCFSLSPTIPDTNVRTVLGYSKYRRIGSVITNAADTYIRQFIQRGDWFYWDYPYWNVDSGAALTNAVYTATLTTPSGINVLAFLNCLLADADADVDLVIRSPDLEERLPSKTSNTKVLPFLTTESVGVVANAGYIEVYTGTSSDVKYSIAGSGGNTDVTIMTVGYKDPRGKNQ